MVANVDAVLFGMKWDIVIFNVCAATFHYCDTSYRESLLK